MSLPVGYRSILIADTRRAEQWKRGLHKAGFDVVLAETQGHDVEKGSWEIGVVASQTSDANAMVSAVLRGDRKLPLVSTLSKKHYVAVVVVVIGIVSALILS